MLTFMKAFSVPASEVGIRYHSDRQEASLSPGNPREGVSSLACSVLEPGRYSMWPGEDKACVLGVSC